VVLPCSFFYPLPNHARRTKNKDHARRRAPPPPPPPGAGGAEEEAEAEGARGGAGRLALSRAEEAALAARAEVFAAHLWARSWQGAGAGDRPASGEGWGAAGREESSAARGEGAGAGAAEATREEIVWIANLAARAFDAPPAPRT